MKKRKFIVLVADGMADYPIAEIDNRTPLEVARTPNMDYLAEHGRIGQATFVPAGMTPGSDVANLSIFGYDPTKYHCGRGPLEAINLGIELEDNDIVFRCNLITIENEILVDYSAGHISSQEAKVLINYIDKQLGNNQIHFYPGVSYRHIMIIKEGTEHLLKLSCTPPHDITGKNFLPYLPQGVEKNAIIEIMKKSHPVLSAHEINQVRIDLKENPANMIWLWGQGRRIKFPTFKEKYGLNGAVISAVDLIKGIGRAIGLESIYVPGATGYYDTNYEGKADYAIKSLKKNDFVFVHVEAPDEAGHNADLRAKITAIENFDRYIVGKILSRFKNETNVRIMVLSDHPTPISLKTHTADPVCFVVWGEGIEKDEFVFLNEPLASKSGFNFPLGCTLMDYFISS